MSDWWSRRISEMQPQPQVPRLPVPSTNQGPLRFPPASQQPQPIAPVQQRPQQVVEQEYQTAGKSYKQVANELDPDRGKVLHLAPIRGEAAKRGELNTTCPNCGSFNVFTRSNAESVVNTTTGVKVHPHARCYECGWTESNFIPGNEGNWVS